MRVTVTEIGDDRAVSRKGITVSGRLADSSRRMSGDNALQRHGGMDMPVEFKDIAPLKRP